ncbi:MAG: antitoxin Xre/MbcA/ParS toxin-binding domain-containing protein [Geobacter sp.]
MDKLDNLCLIKQDSTGVWRLANPGMQAWLHLLLTTNDPEKAEHLRFGEWAEPTSKQLMLTKAVLRAAEQLNISMAQLALILGVGRTTVKHLVSGNYELSPAKKEWELGTLFVRMNIALDVLVGGSQADAQKWLNSGNTAFGGQKPIQLIATVERLVRVVQYLESVDK